MFVGDSLHRDILMAQRCNVHDIYARYGTEYNEANYDLLVDISHWTEDEIQKKFELRELKVEPTYTIDSFSELSRVIHDIERI